MKFYVYVKKNYSRSSSTIVRLMSFANFAQEITRIAAAASIRINQLIESLQYPVLMVGRYPRYYPPG